MFDFPINYHQPVFRPPSEGRSFLIQVTLGCSNNKCTYCDMYRSKKYQVRELASIIRELEESKIFFTKQAHLPERIFLCDGDALGAPMKILIPVLKKINELYPGLDRIGIYATAQNILDKTSTELQQLSALKLNIAYLGLESGDEKVLHMIVKGNTKAEMVESSLKIKAAGFKLSTIAMLGIGGRKYTPQHIEETADIISITSPEYFSFLTTMAIPGTPYHKMVERGLIEPLTTKELFFEMREIISKIVPSKNEILFRANHVSNQYPLGGKLSKDTNAILKTLDQWISKTEEGVYPPMPSSM